MISGNALYTGSHSWTAVSGPARVAGGSSAMIDPLCWSGAAAHSRANSPGRNPNPKPAITTIMTIIPPANHLTVDERMKKNRPHIESVATLRVIAFGFVATFMSSFGQTFFVGLFSPQFGAAAGVDGTTVSLLYWRDLWLAAAAVLLVIVMPALLLLQRRIYWRELQNQPASGHTRAAVAPFRRRTLLADRRFWAGAAIMLTPSFMATSAFTRSSYRCWPAPGCRSAAHGRQPGQHTPDRWDSISAYSRYIMLAELDSSPTDRSGWAVWMRSDRATRRARAWDDAGWSAQEGAIREDRSADQPAVPMARYRTTNKGTSARRIMAVVVLPSSNSRMRV